MAGWGYFGTRIENHVFRIVKAKRMTRYAIGNGFDHMIFPLLVALISRNQKPAVRYDKAEDSARLGNHTNFADDVLTPISATPQALEAGYTSDLLGVRS